MCGTDGVEKFIDDIIELGDDDVFRKAYNFIKDVKYLCCELAYKNKYDWMLYAIENGYKLCEKEIDDLCDASALGGSVKCLEYAHKTGGKINMMTNSLAIYGGSIECLRYLHENGCELHPIACSTAARKGNLECLKYAHENGCKLYRKTCIYAVQNGNLECLKYVHDNGCEITDTMSKIALDNGHIDCYEYIENALCK